MKNVNNLSWTVWREETRRRREGR